MLAVTRVVRSVGHGPLKRPEALMVNLNISLSILVIGLLLTQSTAAVLKRGKDSRTNIDIVSQALRHTTQPPGQQLASLDGHGCQLGLVIQNISNCEDVWNTSLLLGISQNFPIFWVELDTDLVQTDIASAGISAYGEDHGVKLINIFGTILILGIHLNFPRRSFLYPFNAGWDALSNHVDPVVLHVLPYLDSHLLVEAPKQDTPDHDRGITPQSREEASTLQSNITGTYQECLARGMGQRENVVRTDSKLRSWYLWVSGSSSSGEDELSSGHSLLLPLLVCGLECVFIHKLRILIQVGHFLFPQGHPVAPVESPNVILDLLHHLGPVVLDCLLLHLPAETLGVLHRLS